MEIIFKNFFESDDLGIKGVGGVGGDGGDGGVKRVGELELAFYVF